MSLKLDEVKNAENTAVEKIPDAVMHPVETVRRNLKPILTTGLLSLYGQAVNASSQDLDKIPELDYNNFSIPAYQFTNPDGTQRTEKEMLEGLRNGTITLQDKDGNSYTADQMDYDDDSIKNWD